MGPYIEYDCNMGGGEQIALSMSNSDVKAKHCGHSYYCMAPTVDLSLHLQCTRYSAWTDITLKLEIFCPEVGLCV